MAANSQFAMAVHILAMLASSRDENLSSSYIAGSVNTNAVVIRRLLGQLGHAKLVVSQTGANGGTRLSRCPDEINLSEVYQAVNCGEVFALHSKGPNRDCPVGRNMESVLCNLQKEIDHGIYNKLSQYTLANLFEKVETER
ncbi:MAG: Rrf2 family transcriptional regulator [Blastocatellia bacterium]|nr:Rrf2 family transcriptional regulator [Blastocatellia bacterium]